MIKDTAFVRGGIAANIILPVLATIAVALRFFARWSKKNKLRSDDWVIVGALIPSIGVCVSGIYAAYMGLRGAEGETIGRKGWMTYRKIVFADYLICHFVFGLVKISILLFYKRIFATKKFRIVANILLVLVSLWMMSAFFFVFFSARRVTAFWKTEARKEGTQYRFRLAPLITANSILDITLHVIILALPLPLIKKLKLSRRRKFFLSGVFLLGSFCLVASGVRLYWSYMLFSYHSKKASRSRFEMTDQNSLWAHVEACVSVVACCLPTIYTIFRSPTTLKEQVSNARQTVFFTKNPFDMESANEAVPKVGPFPGVKSPGDDIEERNVIYKTMSVERWSYSPRNNTRWLSEGPKP